MRNSVVGLFSVVVLSACGDADSVADIGSSDTFAAEEEVGSTGDALLSNAAKVWLPMAEGNSWTFTSASGATRTVAFYDVQSNIGWLDGLTRSGHWTGLASSAPNTLYSYNYDFGQWEPLFRFGYAVTSWTIGAGCDKFTLSRTETDANVVVPAGSFTGVRTITFQHNPPLTARCVVPLISSVSFAPGVGPVLLVAGGGEKFTLKSAVVNGKKYPLAPTGQVTSKLVFDKTSYTNKSNTIRCITTPCPGNGVNAVAKYAYTVTNGTAETKTWQFSTGCQHDLTLSTSTGKLLASASDSQFCTQSLTNITLAPGGSRTLSGQIELIDAQGLQLEGTLTAKAYLNPRSGVVATPVAPATTTVSVTIVPALP